MANKIYKKNVPRLMRVTIEMFVSPEKDSSHEQMLLSTIQEIKAFSRSGEIAYVVMNLKDVTEEDEDVDGNHRHVGHGTRLPRNSCNVCQTDPPWHKLDCTNGSSNKN